MSCQELAKAFILPFGTLSLADSVLTYFGLRYGRLEGNPIARFLPRHGAVVGYGVKLTATALTCLGFWYIADLMPVATFVTVGVLALSFAVVVIHDAIVLYHRH